MSPSRKRSTARLSSGWSTSATNSIASARRRAALGLSVHLRGRQGWCSQMSNVLLEVFVITLGLIGPAMAQECILISSDWGQVTAELAENDATRSLVRMLPLTIEMRAGSGFLNRLDKWSLCLTAARMAAEQERR